MSDVVVTVEIGRDEYAYLLTEANARNVSVSELVNGLLDDYLRRNENGEVRHNAIFDGCGAY